MKFNAELQGDIEYYKSFVILVEGQKDAAVLRNYGFERVYSIHKTGVSIRERIEEISKTLDKKDKVCILTDLDKKGKELYELIKPILQELGVTLDSSFRGLMLKAKAAHVEGLSKFLDKVEHPSKYPAPKKKGTGGRGRPHAKFRKRLKLLR